MVSMRVDAPWLHLVIRVMCVLGDRALSGQNHRQISLFQSNKPYNDFRGRLSGSVWYKMCVGVACDWL